MSAARDEQVTGPVPPRDFDAEQATLGSMLLEPGAAARVFAIVNPDDFYWQDHAAIYAAAQACRERNEPVDLVTVSSELRRTNQLQQVGGGEYLVGLITSVPTTAHVARYATIVAEKAYNRAAIRELAELQALAYSDPDNPLDITNAMVSRATQLANTRLSPTEGLRTWADAKDDIVGLARTAAAGRRGLSIQRLGIDGLDRMIGPLANHRLVLVKGGSGSGKSHLLVNAMMATAMQLVDANDPRRVCVFSTEQPGMYVARGLAWASGINSMEILNGFDGSREPDKANTLLAIAEAMADQFQVSIEEGEVTEDRIEADLHRHAAQYGIAMVIFDYWQEIELRPGRTKREEFVSLAKRMKHLSQDVYKVPFLIGSQVTYNQGSKEWQAAESQQIQRASTMTVRLDRDPKQRERYTLHNEKQRVGIEFGSLPLHLDKRVSRVYLQDDHRPAEERGPWHDG